MNIEKYISSLLVLLIHSPILWVRAFGFRLAMMKRVFTTDTETMAVDGVTWYVNPVWTLANSKFKNLYVSLHECKHVMSRHPERLRDCLPGNQPLLNKAADYAVNFGLEQANCPYPMPSDALINRDYVDDNGHALNVERIIPLLISEEQSQEPDTNDESFDTPEQGTEENGIPATSSNDGESDSDSASGDTSDDQDSEQDTGDNTGANGGELECNNAVPEVNQCGELWPAPDDMDVNESAQDNIAAVTLAQSAGGSVPDWLQHDIHEAAQNSVTDWLAVFRDRFANVIDQSDYSYRKINAAYAMIGMIAPTLYNDGIGKVVIAGDESSSMSDEELNHCTEQTAAVLSEWMPQEVIIVRHTSDIVHTEYLSQGEEPTKRKKRAHGGTSFQPVIDLAERECADVLIWITDCMPMDNPKESTVPTIWLGTGYGAERYYQTYLNWGDFIKVD